MEKGDYVLATKYSDGGPRDHWVVGFFSRMLCEDRFIVTDADGQSFRANGFRRCEKITEAEGASILGRVEEIEQGEWSLWRILENLRSGGDPHA